MSLQTGLQIAITGFISLAVQYAIGQVIRLPPKLARGTYVFGVALIAVGLLVAIWA